MVTTRPVVKQAIENGGRHDGIPKYAAPFTHRAIGRDEQAAPLVASRHWLKEQVRGIWLERHAAV
jgi:hypothetical protein